MEKSTLLGLFAILGIWITAGFALPLVNVLTMFTPEQLLAARGFLTALIAYLILRGRILGVDRYTLLIVVTVAFASLGLFKGVRTWGAGPTIIIVTATPIVNFFLSWMLRKPVYWQTMVGFMLTLGGVILAHLDGQTNAEGLSWSILAMVANGLLYECFARARATALQKCFWGSIGIGTIGLSLSYSENWEQIGAAPVLGAYLLGFAFLGGFLYWIANVIAFERLPKDVASVLAQGETPAVILIAWLLLGEQLSLLQWMGVFIALGGAWYLSRWVSIQSAAAEERAA